MTKGRGPESSKVAYGVIKRVIDVCASLVGLIVLSPLLLVVACLIRVKLGRPVLFRQMRPGLNEQPFYLCKFRTMRDAVDSNGQQLPDRERMTPFGAVLRLTSIDELPSLFNVLRGDLTLVGPRPLLMRYLPHFSETERLRFKVKPGITGWAQVHGRNELTWARRLQHDVWYVEHRSLLLDLRILLLTCLAVFKRSGVVVDPGSRMKDLDEERTQSA